MFCGSLFSRGTTAPSAMRLFALGLFNIISNSVKRSAHNQRQRILSVQYIYLMQILVLSYPSFNRTQIKQKRLALDIQLPCIRI
jgi:hypothetical protein